MFVSLSADADRKANTRGSWFESRAAYHSNCSVELPLRNSARALRNTMGRASLQLLEPRLLLRRLRAEECG